MSWEKAVSEREPRSESELRRLRAYEGLFVVVVMIAAVLICGSTVAVKLSSSLGDVARALAPASQ